ncbi:exported hypothetical protein [Candidatus Sulfopaludibacter sp. SbA4]|nr:exported hypothetical protein [Candidatus Sulfopaludibacter sp. SbA4]
MFKRSIYTCVAVCAAMLAAGQALKSQAPAAPQWEVATVGQWSGKGRTCIATSRGCQGEEITADGGTQDAIMKAASTLGEQGWELVSVTANPGDGWPTLYFRRPKATR